MNSTLLYSTLLCSALLYSTLLYSTLLYSALLCSALLYSTLLYSTLLCSALLYSTLLDSTLLCSALLYSSILYLELAEFRSDGADPVRTRHRDALPVAQCGIHLIETTTVWDMPLRERDNVAPLDIHVFALEPHLRDKSAACHHACCTISCHIMHHGCHRSIIAAFHGMCGYSSKGGAVGGGCSGLG